MRQKKRQAEAPAPNGGAPGDDSDKLAAMREKASRFLAAGDAAINSALAKTDSETFLNANKQTGGE